MYVKSLMIIGYFDFDNRFGESAAELCPKTANQTRGNLYEELSKPLAAPGASEKAPHGVLGCT